MHKIEKEGGISCWGMLSAFQSLERARRKKKKTLTRKVGEQTPDQKKKEAHLLSLKSLNRAAIGKTVGRRRERKKEEGAPIA